MLWVNYVELLKVIGFQQNGRFGSKMPILVWADYTEQTSLTLIKKVTYCTAHTRPILGPIGAPKTWQFVGEQHLFGHWALIIEWLNNQGP